MLIKGELWGQITFSTYHYHRESEKHLSNPLINSSSYRKSLSRSTINLEAAMRPETSNSTSTRLRTSWILWKMKNEPRTWPQTCLAQVTNLWANCFTPKKLSSWVGLIVERSKWYVVQPWSIRSVVTTKYVLPQRDRKEKSSERKDN